MASRVLWSLGRKTLAGSVAGSAAVASTPAASARVPPQVATQHNPGTSASNHKLAGDGEEWLWTDGQNTELILFNPYKPEEIDAAIGELKEHMQGGAPRLSSSRARVEIQEEEGGEGVMAPVSSPRSGTETPASEAASFASGESSEEADFVIQATQVSSQPPTGANGGMMDDLLQLTGRFLRSPGLQREIVKVMMEDKQVQELMLRQNMMGSLQDYLMAAQMPITPLLEGSGESEAQEEGRGTAHDGSEEEDLVARIVKAVETSFKVAGGAFGLLGGWLRDRVHDLGTTLATILGMPLPPPQQQQQPAEHVEGQEQTAGGNRRRGGAPPRNKALYAVMAVAVAVLCLLLARRPVVLRRMPSTRGA